MKRSILEQRDRCSLITSVSPLSSRSSFSNFWVFVFSFLFLFFISLYLFFFSFSSLTLRLFSSFFSFYLHLLSFLLYSENSPSSCFLQWSFTIDCYPERILERKMTWIYQSNFLHSNLKCVSFAAVDTVFPIPMTNGKPLLQIEENSFFGHFLKFYCPLATLSLGYEAIGLQSFVSFVKILHLILPLFCMRTGFLIHSLNTGFIPLCELCSTYFLTTSDILLLLTVNANKFLLTFFNENIPLKWLLDFCWKDSLIFRSFCLKQLRSFELILRSKKTSKALFWINLVATRLKLLNLKEHVETQKRPYLVKFEESVNDEH